MWTQQTHLPRRSLRRALPGGGCSAGQIQAEAGEECRTSPLELCATRGLSWGISSCGSAPKVLVRGVEDGWPKCVQTSAHWRSPACWPLSRGWSGPGNAHTFTAPAFLKLFMAVSWVGWLVKCGPLHPQVLLHSTELLLRRGSEQAPKTANSFPLPAGLTLFGLDYRAVFSCCSNKASGGDGILVELFQILKDDAVKVLHSVCQKIWKTQQWPQDWKRSVFIPIPKKGNSKECSNYSTIALISHASKVTLKILQARLQQYVNRELSEVQADFRKGRGTAFSNCQHPLDHWKSKRVPQKHLFLLYWLCQSLWLCGSQ